ncbi:MAG: hypothetical protein KDB07_12880, partial [Planctomycetes bacterium]|nr:hypothetical protein [Planctomycetota bacterium]
MKKDLSLLVSAALVSIGLSACAANSVPQNERPQSPRLDSIESIKAGQTEASDDLAVMTGRERTQYFELKDDFARKRFIVSNGIDVRRTMKQNLRVGMSRDEVISALEGSYDAMIPTGSDQTRLLFQSFSGRSTTNMYCLFDVSYDENYLPQHSLRQ